MRSWRGRLTSVEGAGQRPTRGADPRIVAADDLEQVDEPQADGLAVVAGCHAHQVDETSERVVNIPPEHVEISDEQLCGDVARVRSRRRAGRGLGSVASSASGGSSLVGAGAPTVPVTPFAAAAAITWSSSPRICSTGCCPWNSGRG